MATYPSLSLAAVYAALAYDNSHRAEIEADMEADEQFAAEMKSTAGPSKLTQKLPEFHAARDPLPPEPEEMLHRIEFI